MSAYMAVFFFYIKYIVSRMSTHLHIQLMRDVISEDVAVCKTSVIVMLRRICFA